MDEFRHLLAELRSLDILLFRLGTTDVTIFGLIKLILLVAGLFVVTARLDRLLRTRVLERTNLDLAARVMLAAIVRYLVLLLGFLIILQTSGINLTSLNVLAGALGVGVGFGLQNIVSNFMSGLIIMFERSIKVGDRIELGDVEGEVLGPVHSCSGGVVSKRFRYKARDAANGPPPWQGVQRRSGAVWTQPEGLGPLGAPLRRCGSLLGREPSSVAAPCTGSPLAQARPPQQL